MFQINKTEASRCSIVMILFILFLTSLQLHRSKIYKRKYICKLCPISISHVN